jgi:hypothetical protein
LEGSEADAELAGLARWFSLPGSWGGSRARVIEIYCDLPVDGMRDFAAALPRDLLGSDEDALHLSS